MEVTRKRRIIDLGLALVFVAFCLEFHTLVMLNLHAIDRKEELVACFGVPVIVTLVAIVRFFRTPYIGSLFNLIFDGSENEERTFADRVLLTFLSIVTMSLFLSLTAWELMKKNYLSESYTIFEWIVCSILALAFSGICIYWLVKNKGRDKNIYVAIIACIIVPLFGAMGWWLGTGIRTLYEMIFLYPEVLRW